VFIFVFIDVVNVFSCFYVVMMPLLITNDEDMSSRDVLNREKDLNFSFLYGYNVYVERLLIQKLFFSIRLIEQWVLN